MIDMNTMVDCILYYGFVNINILYWIIYMYTMINTICFTNEVGICTNNWVIDTHKTYLDGIEVHQCLYQKKIPN
jgi:hypothetical protein